MKRLLTISLPCITLITSMAYGMDPEARLLARLDSISYNTTDLGETGCEGLPGKLQKFLSSDVNDNADVDQIQLWAGSKTLTVTESQRSAAINIVAAAVNALEKRGKSGQILSAEGDEEGTWGIDLEKFPLPGYSRLVSQEQSSLMQKPSESSLVSQENKKSSLMQSLVIPTVKYAGVMTASYLLCKYFNSSNQSNQ